MSRIAQSHHSAEDNDKEPPTSLAPLSEDTRERSDDAARRWHRSIDGELSRAISLTTFGWRALRWGRRRVARGGDAALFGSFKPQPPAATRAVTPRRQRPF